MDTKTKILTAAMSLFAEKGKHGTRMEEIATAAAVNKAMPYYFFTTKENLFHEVLTTAFHRIAHQITDNLGQCFDTTKDPRERIRMIVDRHFTAFSRNTIETKLLLNAMASCPDCAKKALDRTVREHPEIFCPEKFVSFFQECIDLGIFRQVDPRQTLISIIGMNLIYFVAKPISQLMLNQEVTDESEFLAKRHDCVIDLIFHGILNDGRPS